MPEGPSNFRGVGATLGVGAMVAIAVAGPLWKAVGGADSGAGAVEPPTGVATPEATIAGTTNTGGDPKVGVVVSQLRNSREREPKLRYHPTMVHKRKQFCCFRIP